MRADDETRQQIAALLDAEADKTEGELSHMLSLMDDARARLSLLRSLQLADHVAVEEQHLAGLERVYALRAADADKLRKIADELTGALAKQSSAIA